MVRSSRVTSRNIEQKVKDWADAFRLSRKIETDNKAHYFGLVVELPSKLHVTVRREKARPSYLTLRNRIGMSEKHRVVFDKMTKEKQESVIRAIRLECLRSRIEFHLGKNLEFVCIHKLLPITPDLTEAQFIDSLTEVNFASGLVISTISGFLEPPA